MNTGTFSQVVTSPTRSEEIGKAFDVYVTGDMVNPPIRVMATDAEAAKTIVAAQTGRRILTLQAFEVGAPDPFEVSGFRKVILQGYGRAMRKWAYGQQWRTPRVTEDGIRVAPHREFYTDADAQAVVEYMNQRVSL